MTDLDIAATIAEIERALFEFIRDHNVNPTHILLDPKTHAILRHSDRWQIVYTVVQSPNKTLFNIPIVDIMRPYPFIAIACLNTLKETN